MITNPLIKRWTFFSIFIFIKGCLQLLWISLDQRSQLTRSLVAKVWYILRGLDDRKHGYFSGLAEKSNEYEILNFLGGRMKYWVLDTLGVAKKTVSDISNFHVYHTCQIVHTHQRKKLWHYKVDVGMFLSTNLFFFNHWPRSFSVS